MPALALPLLAVLATAAAPAKVAVIREPESPVGDAVIDALLADPDDGVVRFEVRARPVDGSRVAAAKGLCAEKLWRGVYWFDTTRDGEYWVVLYDCADGRVRVREVPVDTAAEQATIEEMWLIARGSATALVTGVAIAMDERDAATVDVPVPPKEPLPEVEPREPEPPPPSTPKRRRPWLRASAAYAGDGIAKAVPWQHAVTAGFAIEPTRLLRVGLAYAFAFPAELRDADDVKMSRHVVAAQVGVFGGIDRLTVEGRASLEVEMQRWRSDDDPDGGLRVVPTAALDVLFAIRLWRGLFLELGPGLGVPLARVDYVLCRTEDACTGDDRVVVASSWPVRPRARAGFAVRF
jgi:hypothetical protein